MQTAIDCNGSKGPGTTTTTTTTIVGVDEGKDKTHERLSLEALPSTSAVTTLTPDQPNFLRHRLQAGSRTAATTTTTTTTTPTTTTNYKNGNAHLIDAAEYLGSNVEQMSATPSPSPQASPSRKCKQLPPVALPVIAASTTTAATAAAAVTAVTAVTLTSTKQHVVVEGSNNISSSSSSSNSNSNSNSTTSSVIATPVMARNGNAFVRDSNANAIANSNTNVAESASGDRTTTDRNALLATQMLPLPSKSASLTTFDDNFFTTATSDPNAADLPLTPMTPASMSSKSPSSTPSLSVTTLSVTPASVSTPATSPSKSPSSLEEQLLQWQDMPQYLQFNPYVLKGYRPLQTFKGCLFSLFYWHNETINILTHALPIVYILAIVPGLMPWEKGYRFLSFCHVFGSVAPWCGSFVYHLFMNIEKGENVYYRLLKLDMVGIWVSQSFGALPLVTATTFCFSSKWKWLILISYSLLSLWGLYKALTASSPWQRRLCFAMPFTMRSILTFLRTLSLVGGNRVALPHVYLQDGVSILGGAIGAMRIPEKWFPGLVDFYLNSHNIMHVLVVVAVYSMHKATIKDFEWMSVATCDTFTNATNEAIQNSLSSNMEL